MFGEELAKAERSGRPKWLDRSLRRKPAKLPSASESLMSSLQRLPTLLSKSCRLTEDRTVLLIEIVARFPSPSSSW